MRGQDRSTKWPLTLPKDSLGEAVAASAAVPGLFPPMQLTGLYEYPLQLVDGGMYDNQGIDALLDAGCTDVVVSDAGGQLIGIERAPVGSLARPCEAAQSDTVAFGS